MYKFGNGMWSKLLPAQTITVLEYLESSLIFRRKHLKIFSYTKMTNNGNFITNDSVISTIVRELLSKKVVYGCINKFD